MCVLQVILAYESIVLCMCSGDVLNGYSSSKTVNIGYVIEQIYTLYQQINFMIPENKPLPA